MMGRAREEKRKITKLVIFLLVNFISLGWFSPAWGHLCDDVWRQRDKLIVKPEFQNLVIKDRTQFKVFLKNNMDRAIAEISLEARSQAFDIEISPERMQVPNNRKVHFDVKVSLKENISSGKYPINFRLVAKGKTFKRFDMSTQLEKKKEIRTPPATPPAKPAVKPGVTTHGVSMLKGVKPPAIDGDLHDSSWKNAAMFTDFKTTTGKRAVCQTIAFLNADKNNIYVGISCQEKYPGRIREDCVEISIYPPIDEEACYTFRIGTGGTVKAYKTTPATVQTIDGGTSAKVLLPEGGEAWFAEVAIPIAIFGVKALKEEDTWRMNFARERVTAEREISFWSGSATTFREQRGCGEIHFLP